MNGGRILLVSQSQVFIRTVKDGLQQMEVHVVTCSDGFHEEGFDPVRGVKGILLDLDRPHSDGLSILKYLRKLHPSISIIALSSQENLMNLVHAMEEGVTDYILKPIDPALLQEKCSWLVD